tara:strand:+ start:582 stop:1337 length:756 start_codon:yes stop_codon:yes gene_type:complete
MNDIITTSKNVTDMTVTDGDVEALGRHVDTIKKFVQSQLKEGMKADYATIPYTHAKSLLKPGAEKLMRLFKLGVKQECIDRELDLELNYASFTYRATVYHLGTGVEIAQCEGMANKWEKKYKIKTNGQDIPVSDIMNTLMKMAQKRAMVGAVIQATGASDFFTQDEDEIQAQQHKKQNKAADSSAFTSKPEGSKTGDFICNFGKTKGKTLSEIGIDDVKSKLDWIAKNVSDPNGNMEEFIKQGNIFIQEAS